MNAPIRNSEHYSARARVIARLLMLAVIVISQGLIWWPVGGIRNALSDHSTPRLIVSVLEGDQYGSAHVSLNEDSPITIEQAAERLARGSLPHIIELRVAGGVAQRDVARLRRAILQGAGDRSAIVRFRVIEDFSISDVGVEETERSSDVSLEAPM